MKSKLTFVFTTLMAIVLCSIQYGYGQTGNWKLAGNTLAGTEKLGSKNNFPVVMVTNDTQRIRIDGSGLITVGLNSGPLEFMQFGTSAMMKFPQNQYIFRHSNSQEGLYNNQSLQRIEYRDQVTVPSMWGEWASTGRSYFRGNMGIGADPNTARLFVKNTAIGELSRFDGGNTMYNSIYENGVYRGYWGSYAGNAEDVDIGTGGGNTTGKLHLTIQAVPKVTIDASGRMGIGTTTPEGTLHVFRGSAGTVTANANAPLVIENSTSNYIDVLAPSSSERGILFGDNLDPQDGGIIYNGATNAMQFRTNGNFTNMVLDAIGNVGMGTLTPARRLDVVGSARLGGNGSNRYLEFFHPSLEDYRFDHTGSWLYMSFSDDNFSSFTDIARFSRPTDTYQFTVYGDALASGGVWTNSDQKIKRDVRDFSSAMDIVKQLKPKTYFFKTDEYKKLNLPRQKQYGFIAQELEQVVPELVKISQQPVGTHANGERKTEELKAVNYTELIPILTRAIQEQQQQIDELKQMLIKLAGQPVSAETGAVEDVKTMNAIVSNASLEQNTPNPVVRATSIRYNIPGGLKNAQLRITDFSGKTFKQIALNGNDAGTINIDASALINGTYTYSLLVDGKIIESKKMVVSH